MPISMVSLAYISRWTQSSLLKLLLRLYLARLNTIQVWSWLRPRSVSSRSQPDAREFRIRTVSNSPYPASQILAETSRLYDLSMVAQPNHAKPSPGDLLPEAVLFNSGRPMLMVPYIHVGPAKLERVLICWDGGRLAARAIHDAMPFLHKAKVIDVVTVNGSDSTVSEVSATALTAHLARHDISAGVQQPTANAADIHNTILSLAADKSSDLIVMGGYGHSKLREFILGGVTRGMFESLTVPALISH